MAFTFGYVVRDVTVPSGKEPFNGEHLLAPYPAELMEAYPVSTLVNSPANDRQECAEPFRDTLF